MNGVFLKHILDLDSWISKSEWIQGQKFLRGKDSPFGKPWISFHSFQFLRSSHTISMSKHELSLSHLLWQTEETCKCLKCNISQFSVTLFDLLHRLKITKTGFSRPVTGCCSWRTSYNNSREAISSGTMQRNSKSQRFDCRFRAQTLLLHTAVGD